MGLFVYLRIIGLHLMKLAMKQIKVLGTGCPKCKTMYQNALEAVKQLGAEVEVVKIEDIEEILKYNVLTTPVLMIDEVIKTKGRVADVQEIKTWLTA